MVMDFFRFQTDYYGKVGFSLFGPNHIIWLLILLIVCVMSTWWYKKLTIDKQDIINIILGVAMPVMGIYRDIVLVITGHFDEGFLPLHLCSMALWIGAIYVLTKWRYIGVVYVLLCVPGAISALLFPDWNMYPLFNYMHIHSFLSHGCIVILGIWLVASGKIRINIRDIWMPLSFAIIGVMIIYPINCWLGTNYWFLNSPSDGSPLVYIEHIFGEKGYLLGYGLFCFLIMLIWWGFLKLVFSLTKKYNRVDI